MITRDQVYELAIYDKYNIPWRVKFYMDNGSSPVATLLGGDNPITFHFLNESDFVFDPWRPSSVTLQIATTANFRFEDLFTSDEMSCYVEIYQGDDSSAGDIYWQGWVDPKQYKEPYDVPPFYLEIVCIDGLTLLSDILYAEVDSGDTITHYLGRTKESQIILDILNKIEYSEFKEFVNLYDVSMESDVDDSPCDQLLLDPDAFEDMYCDEVLKHILTKYKACIRQVGGIFCIYRPKEIINTTVYGRHFTDGSTSTAITFSPKQYINRIATNTSALRQVPGGVVMHQDPLKKVTSIQNFVSKDSWISNHKFAGDKYDDTTKVFTSWSVMGTNIAFPPTKWFPEEDRGVVLYPLSIVPDLSNYIYQIFGNNAKITNNPIAFSFDYKLLNITGSAVSDVDVCVAVSCVNDAYWVDLGEDDAICTWETTVHYINFTVASAPTKSDGWKTFSVNFDGLLANGPYKIQLFSTNKVVFLLMDNIRFNETSDSMITIRKQAAHISLLKIFGHTSFIPVIHKGNLASITVTDVEEIVSETYTATNAIKGKDVEDTYILSDTVTANIINSIEQFKGSLGVYKIGSLIQTAIDFVASWAASYAVIGTVLTSEGEDIIFTAEVAGVNFTGNTTITPVGGSTLDGTVVNTQPNLASITVTDVEEIVSETYTATNAINGKDV